MKNTALEIIKKIQKEGFEAYWAGGCVRDILLGYEVSDYDIVTSASPDVIEKMFSKTFDVGKHFGVVLAVEKGHEFEIATFRSEAEYKDARHPSKVFFSTAKDDAKRRDFTINGMFYDPIKNKVIDYVGGKKDLKNRMIRFIGNSNNRIKEDYLRLLRSIRFKNKFDFKYEKRTWESICKNSYRIELVSKERITQELNKMFSNKNRAKALDDLSESGLLKYILPEVENMKGVPQPDEFHKEGDVYIHTLEAIKSLDDEVPVVLVWAVLLHDSGKPATISFPKTKDDRIRFNKHVKYSAGIASKVARRLKFSNVERGLIVWLVKNHMRIGDIPKMSISNRRRLMMDNRFPWLLKLFKADIGGTKPRDYSLYNKNVGLYKEVLKQYSIEQKKKKHAPLLSGKDIMFKFNIEQGPIIGKIIKKLDDAQLEGRVNNKEEAFDFIKKNIL